jgi:hypothetical protein
VLVQTPPEKVDSRFSIALPELVVTVNGVVEIVVKIVGNEGNGLFGVGLVHPVTQ